jgi:hypothetical protein
LGSIVIAGAAVLLFVALASMNVAADQLGDPFFGHLSKHTIRYFIIAATALVSGTVTVVFGSPHAANPTR